MLLEGRAIAAAAPGLLLHHAESHPGKSSYAQLTLLNKADGLLFSPRTILGGGRWNPKLGISLENKAGNQRHGPAAWALPPSGTAPWTSHPGDRALPGTSSFTITKDCSNATKWSALLQPCGLCMDGWKDGQTDEGPFHMPAPEQLPAHSRADAGNSRFLLLIDAVLLRHALLQLAGSSEATAVPMLA